MKTIEVPFLPLNRFDSLDISERFSETQSEDDVKPILETCKEDQSEDVTVVLLGMGMEKYINLFKEKNIQLDVLFQLDETDLEEMGISDPKDRKILAENLSFHKTKKFVIPENPVDDINIFSNTLSQLILLQSYCAYIDFQMKKQNMTDYKIDDQETACTYLRAFTESAIIQSQILSKRLYDLYGYDSLFDKILKINNITLPPSKYLPKKKSLMREYVMKVMLVIGFSSLLFFTGKHVIRKWTL